MPPPRWQRQRWQAVKVSASLPCVAQQVATDELARPAVRCSKRSRDLELCHANQKRLCEPHTQMWLRVCTPQRLLQCNLHAAEQPTSNCTHSRKCSARLTLRCGCRCARRSGAGPSAAAAAGGRAAPGQHRRGFTQPQAWRRCRWQRSLGAATAWPRPPRHGRRCGSTVTPPLCCAVVPACCACIAHVQLR